MADHYAAAPDSTARVAPLAPPNIAASHADDRSSRDKGYSLIPDKPELLDRLRAEIARNRQR